MVQKLYVLYLHDKNKVGTLQQYEEKKLFVLHSDITYSEKIKIWLWSKPNTTVQI